MLIRPNKTNFFWQLLGRMEPGGQEVKKPPPQLIATHKKQQTTIGWENVLEGLAELKEPDCPAATGANVVFCSGKQKVHLHESFVRRFTRISDWLPNLSECSRYGRFLHSKEIWWLYLDQSQMLRTLSLAYFLNLRSGHSNTFWQQLFITMLFTITVTALSRV